MTSKLHTLYLKPRQLAVLAQAIGCMRARLSFPEVVREAEARARKDGVKLATIEELDALEAAFPEFESE